MGRSRPAIWRTQPTNFDIRANDVRLRIDPPQDVWILRKELCIGVTTHDGVGNLNVSFDRHSM
jgi:hypothetical protein